MKSMPTNVGYEWEKYIFPCLLCGETKQPAEKEKFSAGCFFKLDKPVVVVSNR